MNRQTITRSIELEMINMTVDEKEKSSIPRFQ
jgi:hypothetical protein